MASVFEIIFKGTGLDSLNAGIKRKIATIASLGAAWGAARAAFSSYLDKQEAMAELDGALQRAGQATSDYKDKLTEIADEMERTAGIADDEMLKAFGTLTRMGMQPDQVEGYAEALKNLSAMMGGNVGQAATMLGRAMNGNYDLFGRMGIQAKSLDDLFVQLAQRGGGLAEDRMKTMRGQAKNLLNAMVDLGEGVVKAAGNLVTMGDGATAGQWMEAFAMTAREVGTNLGIAADKTVQFFTGVESHAPKTRSELKRTAGEMKAAADAARDAAGGTDMFATAQEKLLAALKEVDAAMQARSRREAAMRDASLALKLAEIDEAESKGKIDQDQAVLDRDSAQRAAASDELSKKERDNKNRQDEISRSLPGITDPKERDRLMAERIGLQDEASALPIKKKVLEVQGRTAESRFESARKKQADQENERKDKANDEAWGKDVDATKRQAKEKLSAKANQLADQQPAVTEADAIAVIEQAMGRRLRNEEIRYQKMTGAIQKAMKQIENGRS